MPFVESLAIALLPVVAAFAAGKSPLSAIALLVAFIANLAYADGVVPDESIRSVSAFVGLIGAVEFGRGTERIGKRTEVSIPRTLRNVDAATWIGLVLLASMGVDGFGMIVYRAVGVWIVPETTIVILVLVAGLGMFGKENLR